MTRRISLAVFCHPFFAGLAAVVLTFSACSSDDGEDVTTQYLYCAHYDTSSCDVGPVTAATCANGILLNDCPVGFAKLGLAGSSSSSGRVSSSSLSLSDSVHGSFVYGGKTYKTVKIGKQVWMAENLNYVAQSSSSVSGSMCYNNQDSLCATHGRLYNWAAAMNLGSICNGGFCMSGGGDQHRGICPSGWHIPSKGDWEALAVAAGGVEVAGGKLKSSEHWNYYNGRTGNGADAYDFSALPGGYYNGKFEDIDFHGYWWSTAEGASSSGSAGSYVMSYNNDSLSYSLEVKSSFFSVRCIQD
jgi:uncharacterized protein (TIGR02145 family)